MNWKNFLIIFIVVLLAGLIGYALFLYSGPSKRVSRESRQLKDDIEVRQASVPSMEEETGPPEEAVEPEKVTVASDSRPLEVIEEPSVESQIIQDTSQSPQASGVEDRDSNGVSETPIEALPQSTGEERPTVVIDEDGPATEDRAMIRRSAIALAVENREPKGVSESVSVSQGRVYCWVHVVNGRGEKITVRWIREGQQLHEIHLSVGSDSWRTWAYLTLRPGMIGPAQVDILNEADELLETLSFEITG